MESVLLKQINSPKDLRKLSKAQLNALAAELREFIIDVVSTKEGHLGASLGVTELTIALHYYFNTPYDQLIWDVGHQAYGHKILTGRRDVFETNRKLNGLSGFPKRSESEYDTFGVGHSSTSISAALGMAIASQLKGETEKRHIAVIGDASIASGMAFEGLNHAGVTKANLWVILNDNAMGIDPSVGALKEYLLKAKVGKRPKQDNVIEALNFHYAGPVDGHNFEALLHAFAELEQVEGPKFLHVITKKGKGLQKAEEDQVRYHAPGKFDKITGEILKSTETNLPPKYQDVFGLTLLELAEKNEKIIGITPAMPTGSSLKYMMQKFPERALDVGIAEQHAVTLSAGMATQGMLVFCAIYSTFLQRAYDQMIHDVALQNLPVIFCIDRAGLVGEDGATHHGVFDIAYLRCIPNLIIASPSNVIDLRNLLYTASLGIKNPIAIRYPRGRGDHTDWQKEFKKIPLGKSKYLLNGSQVAVIGVGSCVIDAKKAIAQTEDSSKYSLIDLMFIKPLDVEFLKEVLRTYQHVIIVEDGSKKGGVGEEIAQLALQEKFKGKVILLGIPDQFMHHGTTEELKDLAGISSGAILKVLKGLE
ncbi:1-deoxy-D-xylulose-5-phosphate synthase [Mesonia sp. MT50]|uniref:1-deoxy-D-xylulose-5-phosphate synthase n=1 Tax=Mesonia profundi TaxID=3070998 RepID=A0ABU1A0E7_9FLAO|nr:1-deoxy-D-xylulose-5-phosphate synthase [Mesonia profundi]MDQ7917182.1 1-deoxy-D-xylulose-5-phosphate synthase [Mesonia profundi]